MRIESVKAIPGFDFVNPTIRLETRIEYNDGREAIVKVEGWLKTEEEAFICPLIERLDNDQRKEGIRAEGTYQDRGRNTKQHYSLLTAQLNEKTLKYLENERTKNPKKDVKIKIELNISYIENSARVSSIFMLEPQHFKLPYENIQDNSGRNVNFKILAYAYDGNYSSGANNGWLLSGDSGPEFLKINNQKISQVITIPSSDWINDFAPLFGLGNFAIIEIQVGSEIIPEAWAYVKKADSAFMNWDTKSVYANCRECGILLDKKMEEKFGKKSYTYEERWGRNYSRFNTLSSLDLHLEEKKAHYPSEKVEINKPDAEHLIIITKALVNLAQEIFKD